ncbi:HAMP domain-containing sensor histidine kinase [Rurimicrobium arvi]|uniref:sensor histidine kinase n=1 Tax=Rurimicrobium arvi TaxID=2049916 RepID=UPI0031E17867
MNWRSLLVLTAICIVGASLFFTGRLASRLAVEERKRVALFAEGVKYIAIAPNDEEISLATNIITQDSTIPRIITDEAGHIQDLKGLDTSGVKDVPGFLKKKMEEFRKQNPPIRVQFEFGSVLIYYGESNLLTSLRYFPYAQLAIIALFLVVVVISIGTAHRSIQNQVWVGLSKETAHQLGTPISSIEGWMEIIREELPDNDYVAEMQKDVDRLKLVADRFSKVGSEPKRQVENLVPRLQEMVSYMQKRAPGKVRISFATNADDVEANVSGALFDWVIENLIRNALDAMEGVGNIRILLEETDTTVLIDVSDTGKGIPKHQIARVFQPGFTTKKRGWGLGLSLARRIIENYHDGTIAVKQSEVKKGTTFRIVLPKA